VPGNLYDCPRAIFLKRGSPVVLLSNTFAYDEKAGQENSFSAKVGVYNQRHRITLGII
jgi:hypothetical protein